MARSSGTGRVRVDDAVQAHRRSTQGAATCWRAHRRILLIWMRPIARLENRITVHDATFWAVDEEADHSHVISELVVDR